MNDQWTDRLSDYLDGEVSESERRLLEAHLAGCGACSATLTELRQVVARASALEDRPPATNLWPGIARRIGLTTDDLALRRARERRRLSFTVPQLLAACISLVAVSGATVWLAVRENSGPVTPPAVRARFMRAAVRWDRVEASGDSAVTELRQALTEGRRTGRLDAKTVATLERSLAVIDSAIVEARQALALDPNSAYLNHHLADTMRQKFDFLRQANRIAAART